jgi:hypothetical protein
MVAETALIVMFFPGQAYYNRPAIFDLNLFSAYVVARFYE